MSELRIGACVEKLEEVQNFIKEMITPFVREEKIAYEIEIVVEEIFVNIAHYAYAPQKGEAVIRCEIRKESEVYVQIAFEDQGKAFNPLEKEDADITLSAEERKIGGLGILMVKRMMDNVEYEYKNGRNILTVKKKLR